jgi:hypothetical protein
MSHGLFVHCLFWWRERVKHHKVEEYYPSISKNEDSKRIQGCRDNKNFYRTPLVSSSESWIAGIDERRHTILKVFVLKSRHDEATEIKAAPS